MAEKSDIYVNWILDEMHKGNITHMGIYRPFNEKWKMTRVTFGKYFKKAEAKFIEIREKINVEQEKQILKNETDKFKTKVRTKEQLLARLNDIIDQREIRMGNKTAIPMFSDVLKAIDQYCKMQGYYAAIKQEHEVKNNMDEIRDAFLESLKRK
jgi:hypothetical protein